MSETCDILPAALFFQFDGSYVISLQTLYASQVVDQVSILIRIFTPGQEYFSGEQIVIQLNSLLIIRLRCFQVAPLYGASPHFKAGLSHRRRDRSSQCLHMFIGFPVPIFRRNIVSGVVISPGRVERGSSGLVVRRSAGLERVAVDLFAESLGSGEIAAHPYRVDQIIVCGERLGHRIRPVDDDLTDQGVKVVSLLQVEIPHVEAFSPQTFDIVEASDRRRRQFCPDDVPDDRMHAYGFDIVDQPTAADQRIDGVKVIQIQDLAEHRKLYPAHRRERHHAEHVLFFFAEV